MAGITPSGTRTPRSEPALRRSDPDSDRSTTDPWSGVPLWFWLPIAVVPALLWLFVLPFQFETGPPFLDWNIYRAGMDLWRSTGTP
ncbi:MAG TPA: hypothetical protein VNF73_11340, partial [Candidatus Saccharimonadales bacterium]|nr:hypothetical protein [Candidatus Saccharimonadales bacterium]